MQKNISRKRRQKFKKRASGVTRSPDFQDIFAQSGKARHTALQEQQLHDLYLSLNAGAGSGIIIELRLHKPDKYRGKRREKHF